jgi:hypothetical protein
MVLGQPQRGEDDQHRHQQTTIKKHRNGGAPSALEDGSGMAGRRQKKAGAVRTRRFIDVAKSRGRWHRINPSKARTININTDKQQSAS